jgi:hypothetical protein
MTTTAFDSAASVDGGLPPYNDLYINFLSKVFLQMTDFKVILDPDTWIDGEGKRGTSPFDAALLGFDLLSKKLLEYFDFLVAHSPWFVSAGRKGSVGLNADVLRSLSGSQQEHQSRDNMLAMQKICVELWGGTSKKRRDRGAGDSDDEDDVVCAPKQRRRDLLQDLNRGGAERNSV